LNCQKGAGGQGRGLKGRQ